MNRHFSKVHATPLAIRDIQPMVRKPYDPQALTNQNDSKIQVLAKTWGGRQTFQTPLVHCKMIQLLW